ncbi:adenylyl-sulfate kinase [Limibacter armeniacum]|uniref:adenylyl-sulfate kinase n=1 Tax=Limibacter armeniacum TaxID=466084 RepID=UPI002FE58BB7
MAEKLHIIPHDYKVRKEDRNKQIGHRSFVIWFTGLSGSGKSTIANALEAKLHENGVHTYILDGDNVRSGLNKDLDFSDESREENIRRIGEVANLFVDAGVVTLSAFVSPFAKDRQKVRDIVEADNFVEVFVNCPLEVCEQRDVKGLYKKARAGEISNFTGISSPFEAPENPDVEILSDQYTVEEAIEQLWTAISKKL